MSQNYRKQRDNQYNSNKNKQQQQVEYVVKGSLEEDQQTEVNQRKNNKEKYIEDYNDQNYVNRNFQKKSNQQNRNYKNDDKFMNKNQQENVKKKEEEQQQQFLDDAQQQQVLYSQESQSQDDEDSKNQQSQRKTTYQSNKPTSKKDDWENEGRSKDRRNQPGYRGFRKPQNNYYQNDKRGDRAPQDQKTKNQSDYYEDNQQQNKKKNQQDFKNNRSGQQQQSQQQEEEIKKEDFQDDNAENNNNSDQESIQSIKQAPIKERTEILIQLFKNDKAQCQICCNRMNRQCRIWNCTQCFQPFHLTCITKWIQNIKNSTSHNPQKSANPKQNPSHQSYNWTCPSCQYQYAKEMPVYICFCGKLEEPEYDPYGLPHSCGDQCGKKRGANCPHQCPMKCHPGPCEPCMQRGSDITCYCGRSTREALCNSDIKSFQCPEICMKQLNCGKHFCQQQCHPGPCENCQVVIPSTCYCGQTAEDKKCGEENFECLKVCNRKLDCGLHLCQFRCHKGDCKPCQLKPQIVNKCPCGQFPLTTLTGGNFRKSCTDPIPVCGLPCKKILPCGKHQCKKTCHNGPCPPCTILVEESCKCGYATQQIECGLVHQVDRVPFTCDHKCRKKLSCKVHKCERICCAARNNNINGNADPEGIHLCLKVCGKLLSCNKHTCEMFCHIGICNRCPSFINQPLLCTCGKTRLQPPLPCGTALPECKHPCSRVRACGHPCHLLCHEDPCPPCEEKVSKPCRCGKQLVPNVSCSKEALCLIACTKLLPCGHICGEACHLGECPKIAEIAVSGCGKKCGKVRPTCGHICLAACHPQRLDCPKEPCRAEIRVVCSCGTRETYIECGATDYALHNTLSCNNYCNNLKRFGLFYELNKKTAYYPPMLIRFARQNFQYLLKLEAKIDAMLKNNEESFDMSFIYDQKKRLAVQVLLNRHYKLETQYYANCKNPFFVIRASPNMIIPKPLLSEYLRKVENGQIKPEIMPFEVTLRFATSSSFSSSMFSELDFLLKEQDGEYYIEKEEQQGAGLGVSGLAVYFWDKDQADIAQKKLKKSQSTFSNFVFEVNQKLKIEETKDEHAADEVVRSKKPNVQPQLQKISSAQANAALLNDISQHNEELEKTLLYINNLGLTSAFFLQQEQEEANLYIDRATCTTKCPIQELKEREERMDLSLFEADPSTSQLKANQKLIVKKFLRLESELHPDRVRLPSVLLKTVNYLLVHVVDADALVNVGFKMPKTIKGQKRLINFADIYTFVQDRFLAVRQDLTLVKGSQEYPIVGLPILEQIARFAVLCFSEIASLSQDQDDEDAEEKKKNNKNSNEEQKKKIANQSDFSGKFDLYTHINELSCVLTMIQEIYSQKNYAEQIDKKYSLGNLPEFTAYLLLLIAQKNLHLEKFIEEIKQEILEQEEVKTAIEIICAIKSNDYAKFFKILNSTSYFIASMMSLFVGNMRVNSLKVMQKLKINLTLQQFTEQLCFDSEDDSLAFLSNNGIDTSNLEGPDEYETDPEDQEDNQNSQIKQQQQEQNQQPQLQQTDISQNEEQKQQNNKSEEKQNVEANKEEKVENNEQPEAEVKEKKMKLKLQYINWKQSKKNDNSEFEYGISLLLSDKKNVNLYKNYNENREFNNNNLVSRLYLIKGLWKEIKEVQNKQQIIN